MSTIVIASKRLVLKIKHGNAPDWTWKRWSNPSIFFYGIDIVKKLNNFMLRHKIVN